MHGRLYKVTMMLLMAALLTGVSFLQGSMNADRDRLGLTRITPLENMPPLLAFTTQALGGFRGLISNILWIRANDLQENDKFFEMMQLAEWITKLEPYFVQVWTVQAWNMAYNISVKFKDPADRWRWVKAGIELLRDEGLKYNPKETLIYRELAWFFQHKMGHYLDDAHMYYKQQWVFEMGRVFGKGAASPRLDELINPQTEDQRERARILREEYKMDPEFMKELEQKYGPLEWRLPEAHAIYWAATGMKYAKREDLMTLRRAIYQSMQLSFYRGRLVPNMHTRIFDTAPNLDIFPKVSAAYEEEREAESDPGQKAGIAKAHRNVLRDAVYFFYEANRLRDAQKWFDYLSQKYPNDHLISGKPETLPGNITLDEYAYQRVQEEVGDTSPDRIKGVIMGYIQTAFVDYAIDQDDEGAARELLAQKVYNRYTASIKGSEGRVGLPPYREMWQTVLLDVTNPESGFIPEMRAVLLTKLGVADPWIGRTNAAPGSLDFFPGSSPTNQPAIQR